MPRRNLLFAAFGLIGAASVGLACGPEFPWQLLDNRADTLKATPANSFAYEAAHLAPAPTDALRANEPALEPPAEITRKIEVEGLTAAQADIVQHMRHAPDGDAAMALAKDLPVAVALYTAGAVDYSHGDIRKALPRFHTVLALPEAERASRATWAAYMIGESEASYARDKTAAEAFALTRALASAGAPDPLGLAVASYGEEALLHLHRAREHKFDEAYGRKIAAAVALYAEQAARDSRFGVSSLRLIAQELLGLDDPPTDDAALPAAIGDPMTQRLLVAYALARIEDDVPVSGPNPVLLRLVAAIEASGLAQPAGADRLAALCYRIGRYDLAEKMAGQAEGPLAAWVKAKLALHRGDTDAAAAQYAEASRAFPDAKDAPLDDAARKLLVGEQGVLTLARGDYIGAFERLYPVASTYWGDVAHLADRVLTSDEVKRFVDAHVPEVAPKPKPADDADTEVRPEPATQLRTLLARRLVREGRYADALAYFPSLGDPPIRDWVRDYASSLRDAEDRWWAVDRAEAWFDAAVLARDHGMEIMGTEGAPDYFVHDGDFACCVAQDKLEGAFISDAEKARFAASAIRPDKRWHYRYVAVEAAGRAADLLPPRSQAYAAVLCRATSWVIDRDPPAAQALNRRYLAHGAAVPWYRSFGHECPEPDFAAAARFPREQAMRDARHIASRYRWPIGGGLVLVLATGAWLLRRQAKSV